MKTKFFKTLFVLLISLPLGEGWGGVLLSAQNGVTVGGLAVTSGTVTFNVSWNGANMPEVWGDSVWVFVDYNVSGKMERLPLLAGATLTATSAPGVGAVKAEPGNNRGVWVVGNARTNSSFSATVRLLTATADIAGACVYASNYPPVGEYVSGGITFTGTPPYAIAFSDGSSVTMSISGSVYPIPEGATVKSFSDKTGAPGRIKCLSPVVYASTVSASGFCAGASGVSFALLGTEQGRNYQLFRDGSAVGTVLAGTGSAASFTGTFEEGTYTVRTVPEGGYCDIVMGTPLLVAKNQLPAAPVIASPKDVCVGSGDDIVFLAADYTGELEWLHTGAGTITSSNMVTFGSAVAGAVSITARSAQTHSGASVCYSMESSQSATINTLPAITAQPQRKIFCDASASFTLTVTATPGSGSTLTYQWKEANGANGTDVGTGSSFSTTVSAPSDSPVSVAYWVVVTDNNGCAVTSAQATVTVSGSFGGTVGAAGANLACIGGAGRIGQLKNE
jgi:hypothetical protein